LNNNVFGGCQHDADGRLFFIYMGLKPRIFFDWDVRGRATSGREDPFLFGSASENEMEVPDAWKVMFWLTTAA